LNLSLNDFVDDKPWSDDVPLLQDIIIEDQIEGVRLQRLHTRADGRGDLTVLFSDLKEKATPAPHIYWVTAEAGSIRAWVYHRRQFDRLAFTNGDIRVVLYDLRPDSPTHRKLNILDVSAANKVTLTIPPFVIHGVQNRGKHAVAFINMPTRAYDPAHPDKSRLPFDHPGIPYSFI